ncbi:hypothetical protein F991_02907 [Acinetobacter sp. CIP-A165]|uniref:phage tailspike polysaccharide lyase family protein n=1 Tax=Acinetobacter sp. CIP-A165 TaxID=40373 RepID=UPI0002CE1F7F|nr:hypothetical protein [Acinetobacter sp. CIP-A165]ENU29251.1 hypothetical protein F991_02907 [Acinetobacter sp. CIP-A165]
MALVSNVIGNNIYLYGRLYDEYDTNNVQLFKIDPISTKISNGKIIADLNSGDSGLFIEYGTNIKLFGLNSWGGEGQNVKLSKCYNVNIFAGVNLLNTPNVVVATQYGIVISNCQKVLFTGGLFGATRHSIAIGGNSGLCNIVNRDIKISHATLLRNGRYDAYAGDMHGNVEDVHYDNCVLDAVGFSGKNVSVKNSTIYGVRTPHEIAETPATKSGYATYCNSMLGGYYLLDNCDLIVEGDGSSHGFIYFHISHNPKEDVNIIINDVRIHSRTSKPVETLIRLAITVGVETTKKFNIFVDGLKTFGIPSVNSIIWAGSTTSSHEFVTECDRIQIDNISVPTQNPVTLFRSFRFSTENTKFKLPSLDGRLKISAETAAQRKEASVILPFIYPKVPNVLLSCSPVGNQTWDETFGNVDPYVHRKAASSLRLGIKTNDLSLPLNKLFDIDYTVSMSDF